MESVLDYFLNTWKVVVECLYDTVFTLGKTEILVLLSVVLLIQKKYIVLKNLTYYFWGMLAFLLLPFIGYFINKHTFDFVGYYTGFYNLLPTNFLVAAVITYFIFEIETDKQWKRFAKRASITIVAIFVIFLLGRSNYYMISGNSYDNNMSYLQIFSLDEVELTSLHNEKVSNSQKVIDEVMLEINCIRQDSDSPIIAAPFEDGIYIRQYSPECKIIFGRYDSFWNNEETKSLYASGDLSIIDQLAEECEKRGAEYIIFPLTSNDICDSVVEMFQQHGWQLLEINENRVILKSILNQK